MRLNGFQDHRKEQACDNVAYGSLLTLVDLLGGNIKLE